VDGGLVLDHRRQVDLAQAHLLEPVPASGPHRVGAVALAPEVLLTEVDVQLGDPGLRLGAVQAHQPDQGATRLLDTEKHVTVRVLGPLPEPLGHLDGRLGVPLVHPPHDLGVVVPPPQRLGVGHIHGPQPNLIPVSVHGGSA
jgi:hypothetical protein